MPTQLSALNPQGQKSLTSYNLLTSALADGMPPDMFGLVQPANELPRLKARYRLAGSLKSVALEGYSDSTSQGYSALLRIHLTYSAAEKYGSLFASGSPSLLLNNPESGALLHKILSSPSHTSAFRLVQKRLTNVNLSARLEEADRTLADVLAAFRHTFVHGELSPGAKDDGSPAVYRLVLRVANLACPFVLTRIDEDLSERVERGLAKSENGRQH